jgi:hypothetical protein
VNYDNIELQNEILILENNVAELQTQLGKAYIRIKELRTTILSKEETEKNGLGNTDEH